MRTSEAKPHFILSEVAGTGCGFAVKWKINPHMRPGETSLSRAMGQHSRFVKLLEECGASSSAVPYVSRAHDSVFMKDNAILMNTSAGPRALLAKQPSRERCIEPLARSAHLRELGFTIHGQSDEFLEGGDVVVAPRKDFALLGFGFRSKKSGSRRIERVFGYFGLCSRIG